MPAVQVEDVEAVRMDVDLAEKKEPERTSGTGNGTDLEERWCSGARGSGGTKHCSTSPGRRVDAILAKKNLGTTKEMAPLVIASDRALRQEKMWML